MEKKKTVYMAYGSNLNLRQMKLRCPSARRLGSAVLENHRMVFRGTTYCSYATVEPCDGSSVPVLLWELDEMDEKALDRYEGWPMHYRKADIPIELAGETLTAMIYIMNEGLPLAIPSPQYYVTLSEGYSDCGFDKDFLDRCVKESAGGLWDD